MFAGERAGRMDVFSWVHVYEAFEMGLEGTSSSSILVLLCPLSIHSQGLSKTQLVHEVPPGSLHSASLPVSVFLQTWPLGNLAKNESSDLVGTGWGLVLRLSDKLPCYVVVAGPPTSCWRARPYIKSVSIAVYRLPMFHAESRSYISPVSPMTLSSILNPQTLLSRCLVGTLGARKSQKPTWVSINWS